MVRLRAVTLALTAISCAMAVTPAVAGTTVFSDSTFNNADYTLGAFKDAAVTVNSYGQTLSGGNPGAGIQGTVSSIGLNPKGVLFTALNNGFVYDPTVSGAVTALDFSLDRFANPTNGGTPTTVGSYSLRLLAQQDGTLYQATFVFGPFGALGGTWHGLTQNGISASDFSTLDATNFTGSGVFGGLNFSGHAITFGFAMRGGGTPSLLDQTNDLRADNFRLAVKSASGGVPEPASWAMMIFGLGAVGGAMRSRRRTVVC